MMVSARYPRSFLYTSCVVFICAKSLLVHSLFDDHSCPTGQFKVISKNAETFIRCQSCYMCPPGYGVLRECSETHDTVCRVCTGGFYSDSSTRQGGCQKCRPCRDKSDTLRECTQYNDRVCRDPCPPGNYLDVANERCMPCSFCHQRTDIRVSRNEQCRAQGLPISWVCSSNITVLDYQGNVINTLDTGDEYSYNTISQQKSQRGFRSIFLRSLNDLIQFSMSGDTTPGRPVTTKPNLSKTIQTIPDVIVNNRNDGSPQTSSSVMGVTITPYTPAPLVAEEHCSEGISLAMYWIVTITFVLLICLIIGMSVILYDYHKENTSMRAEHGTKCCKRVDTNRVRNKSLLRFNYSWPSASQQHLLESYTPSPPPYTIDESLQSVAAEATGTQV